MNKTFIVAVIICLVAASNANAQLSKGNILVGTDIANFKLGLEDDAGYDILLEPKAGWFIKDNLAVGAYFRLGFSKANDDGPTTTVYAIGPLARYYINSADVNLLKHGRWYLEANAGIEGRNQSKGGGSTNGLGIGFGPGYAYFVTPNIGLETLLKWNPLIGFGDETFQSNLTLNFGFQIYLPGKATLNKITTDEGGAPK